MGKFNEGDNEVESSMPKDELVSIPKMKQDYDVHNHAYIQVQFYSAKLYMYAINHDMMHKLAKGGLLVVPVGNVSAKIYTERYKVVRFKRYAFSSELQNANFKISRVISVLGMPDELESRS